MRLIINIPAYNEAGVIGKTIAAMPRRFDGIDEVLIQRLISNLVSNSLDASPAGSTIEIRVEPITLSGDATEWQRIKVIDSGSGISPDNLKRVLRPYFTTKIHGDENRGAGLGLAISQKIVQLHGGDLSIASEENQGTTVQVDLPCSQSRSRRPLEQVAE